jgi:hypothetical protein
MDEIKFDELVDNVATALEDRDDSHNKKMILVGEIALVLGAAYVGTRLVQNVIYRSRLNKLYKKTNKIKVEK